MDDKCKSTNLDLAQTTPASSQLQTPSTANCLRLLDVGFGLRDTTGSVPCLLFGCCLRSVRASHFPFASRLVARLIVPVQAYGAAITSRNLSLLLC